MGAPLYGHVGFVVIRQLLRFRPAGEPSSGGPAEAASVRISGAIQSVAADVSAARGRTPYRSRVAVESNARCPVRESGRVSFPVDYLRPLCSLPRALVAAVVGATMSSLCGGVSECAVVCLGVPMRDTLFPRPWCYIDDVVL